MRVDLDPLQVLLVTLAGWINRHQQHVIDYLMAENRVLKGQLTGRRLRFIGRPGVKHGRPARDVTRWPRPGSPRLV